MHRLRRNGVTKVRLAFRTVNSSGLAEQLETGELDIALVSRSLLPNSVPHRPLLEERFMMAQRKWHPRGTRPKEYAALEHVIVSGGGGGFRGFIDEILAEKGLSRRVGLSVQYYSLVPMILQATDFVCTLPGRFLTQYDNALNSFELPFDAGRLCGLACALRQ